MPETSPYIDTTETPNQLLLFQLLNLFEPSLQPEDTKLHLAQHNGTENPLDEFLAGRFEAWQRWQSKRNFGRPFVVSLIELPQKNRWLFAGAYRSCIPTRATRTADFHYALIEILSCTTLKGRLVVDYRKPFRMNYPEGRKNAALLKVSYLRETPLSVALFPGYRKVDISREELSIIHAEQIPSWHSALSSVAGVYLITDTSDGKLYVGSAAGQGGIWQRWANYARNSHGNNKELKRLLKDTGMDHAKYFRFSILEIADVHDSEESVLQRESHWKKILMSRQHGLNAN